MKECKFLTCDSIHASRCPVVTGGAEELELWEHPALERAVNAYLAHGWELVQISRQGGGLTIALLRETSGPPDMTQTQLSEQTVWGEDSPGHEMMR